MTLNFFPNLKYDQSKCFFLFSSTTSSNFIDIFVYYGDFSKHSLDVALGRKYGAPSEDPFLFIMYLYKCTCIEQMKLS